MKSCHDNFSGRFPSFLVYSDRNTPAVIDDCDSVIHMDRDIDLLTKSSESFVNTVVHNFVNQMMQSLRSSASNIHGRSLANSFQPL